ncbi:MAG: (2Fe-2S)-binding protein [Opitutaceae bacterium]|nr:(2Fe-2S)-binding protein [Opitutaceae bacterium]
MKPIERSSGGAGAPAHVVSRRAFLRGLGTAAVTAAATSTAAVAAEMEKAGGEATVGPGEVPLEFVLNGKPVRTAAEPRETLLDVLRARFGLTGAKEGCDRGTCGACTVLLDGKPIYACMRLALEVAGASIETIEGQSLAGGLSPVQAAFVKHDALQCGFCTPGFVMTTTALLRANPTPTEAEVRRACSGHLCRCGSQPHIIRAALAAAGVATTTTSTADSLRHDHA